MAEVLVKALPDSLVEALMVARTQALPPVLEKLSGEAAVEGVLKVLAAWAAGTTVAQAALVLVALENLVQVQAPAYLVAFRAA